MVDDMLPGQAHEVARRLYAKQILHHYIELDAQSNFFDPKRYVGFNKISSHLEVASLDTFIAHKRNVELHCNVIDIRDDNGQLYVEGDSYVLVEDSNLGSRFIRKEHDHPPLLPSDFTSGDVFVINYEEIFSHLPDMGDLRRSGSMIPYRLDTGLAVVESADS